MRIEQEIAETIVNPKAYAAEHPVQEAFTQLRRDLPLGIAEPKGYDPFWVVTKFDDIQAIERQNELFHNGDRAATLVTKDADAQRCGQEGP